MALYDNDGNIRVTVADGNSRGRYAPDGSWYVNVDSGNKGLYGANGCLNVKTWDGTYSVYNPDGGMWVANGVLISGHAINQGGLGPELVVNGTFNTDLTGWSTTSSTAPGTVIWNAGVAEIETSGGGTGRMVQAVPTVIGRVYRFEYSGTMTTRLGTTSGGSDVKALNTLGRSDVGPFDFVATSTSTHISVVDSTDGRFVDNFSLKLLF